MKFAYLLILLSTAVLGCQSSHSDEKLKETTRFNNYMDAQGIITIEELQSNYPIFTVKRTSQPSPQAIEYLNKVTQTTEITAYLGTWCHDSQREIPELIKLKQALSNPNIQLKLIALDRNKKDNLGLAEKAGVLYTPTIIVQQKGKEVGRIIEKTSQEIGLELKEILESATE